MYKKLKDEKMLDSVAGGLYTPAEKNQKGDFAMKDNTIIEEMKKKILENFKQKKNFYRISLAYFLIFRFRKKSNMSTSPKFK